MRIRELAVLALVAVSSSVLAQEEVAMPLPADGLRMVFDVDGAPVTWQMDAHGVVQVDGLPYPGLVLYVPASGVVYYQHPDEAEWLAVAPSMLDGYAYPTVLVDGGKWQPYLDAPTRRWEVKAAQLSCDNWFASAKAGAVTGLTAADVWRVFNAMQWLTAGDAAPVCERLAVAPEMAARVGLPLYFAGPAGRWQLTELGRVHVEEIAMPTNPQPVDDVVRLRLLMHQFGPEERRDMLREVDGLPVAQQLKRIQQMLLEQAGAY